MWYKSLFKGELYEGIPISTAGRRRRIVQLTAQSITSDSVIESPSGGSYRVRRNRREFIVDASVFSIVVRDLKTIQIYFL